MMKIKKYKNKLSALYTNISLNLVFKKKIKKIILKKNPVKLSKLQEKEIKNYFSKYNLNRVNTNWHRFLSSANNAYHIKYIPEDIYYTVIEKALNRKFMGTALMDKNTLSVFFKDIIQPKTIINNINGFYYYNNFLIDKKEAIEICDKYEQFVIKPSIDSGGGKKVNLFSNKIKSTELMKNRINELFNNYNKDFIIQETVIQNKHMKSLNNSSLNTLRIFSYLRNTDIEILSSIVRIGRSGQFTDNSSSGGISCGITSQGTLKKYGYDSLGNQFTVTDNGKKLYNFEIPNFKEVLITAKKLHKKAPNFKLISWDLAIDNENKIVLIEYNVIWQEINFHQLNNGPLFGEFTDEILKKTMNISN